MLTGLLHTHSLLRYFVLIALVIVIVNSFIGMTGKKPFGKWDNKFSLYLLIFTHMQLLIGLGLYLVNLSQNRLVQFSSSMMKNDGLRYWSVEHIFGMLVAITLITVGRVSSKRSVDDVAKHKKLFIYNLLSLAIIVVVILLSDRGLLTMGPK